MAKLARALPVYLFLGMAEIYLLEMGREVLLVVL